MHTRLVRFYEKPRDTREKNCSQCLQVPLIRDDVIEIVMRIEVSLLVDNMGVAFYIRNKEFRLLHELRVDAVNRPVPSDRIFFGNMTLPNGLFVEVKMGTESGVFRKRDEFPVSAERIHNPIPTPCNLSTLNILGHRERKLAVVFDIKRFKRSYEYIVCSGRYTDSDFTARLLQCRKVMLKSTYKS